MRREGHTTPTPHPRHAGGGLVQPGACQGSHIWQDDAGSLAMAVGAWGWRAGVGVHWVAQSPWEGARSRGAALWGCACVWGQASQPSPSCSGEEAGSEKQEVNPA